MTAGTDKKKDKKMPAFLHHVKEGYLHQNIPHGPGAKLSKEELMDFEYFMESSQPWFYSWAVGESWSRRNPKNSAEVLQVVREALQKKFPGRTFGEAYIRKMRSALMGTNRGWPLVQRIKWQTTLPRKCTLPPGKYVIGDPCYYIKNDRWGEYVDAVFGYDTHPRPATPTYSKLDAAVQKWNIIDWTDNDGTPCQCAAFSTVHGDGSYPCRYENNLFYCGVDAGMVGFTPVCAATIREEWHTHNFAAGGPGKEIIDAPYGIRIKYYYDHLTFSVQNHDGTITHGHINLDIDAEEEEL